MAAPGSEKSSKKKTEKKLAAREEAKLLAGFMGVMNSMRKQVRAGLLGAGAGARSRAGLGPGAPCVAPSRAAVRLRFSRCEPWTGRRSAVRNRQAAAALVLLCSSLRSHLTGRQLLSCTCRTSRSSAVCEGLSRSP